MSKRVVLVSSEAFRLKNKCKCKAVPLQAWTGPEGSRRLRLQMEFFKHTGFIRKKSRCKYLTWEEKRISVSSRCWILWIWQRNCGFPKRREKYRPEERLLDYHEGLSFVKLGTAVFLRRYNYLGTVCLWQLSIYRQGQALGAPGGWGSQDF
jgi:hypothetical protein